MNEMIDVIGWVATAVFVSSYFFKRPETLRRVQILGASVWIVYGVLLAAAPVVAANVLLIVAAAWTVHRAGRRVKDGATQSVS
jgi:hypothetical protein